jgi:hypothetical protein
MGVSVGIHSKHVYKWQPKEQTTGASTSIPDNQAQRGLNWTSCSNRTVIVRVFVHLHPESYTRSAILGIIEAVGESYITNACFSPNIQRKHIRLL